jgi:hypothetical protein
MFLLQNRRYWILKVEKNMTILAAKEAWLTGEME